ncbi:MAG: hypothetical protein HOD60_10910 [Candidatus Nitrosopelagicus sp.]|nr:hypothetical protein [Candidatus Nitrosopelagicus sp.]
MDSKIIIIIGLVIALSVIGTAVIMNFMFSDAIQLEKEQKDLNKRLRDYVRNMDSSCNMYEEGVEYNGYFWCESNFEGESKVIQDCEFANTLEYRAWCEYYGFR